MRREPGTIPCSSCIRYQEPSSSFIWYHEQSSSCIWYQEPSSSCIRVPGTIHLVYLVPGTILFTYPGTRNHPVQHTVPGTIKFMYPGTRNHPSRVSGTRNHSVHESGTRNHPSRVSGTRNPSSSCIREPTTIHLVYLVTRTEWRASASPHWAKLVLVYNWKLGDTLLSQLSVRGNHMTQSGWGPPPPPPNHVVIFWVCMHASNYENKWTKNELNISFYFIPHLQKWWFPVVLTVSRHGYFFEVLIILISTCADVFQWSSKVFYYPIQFLTFYLLLWNYRNYLLILKMLTETLHRIPFSVTGRCSLGCSYLPVLSKMETSFHV